MVQFRVTLGAVETVHDTIENTKQQKQHNRFTRKKKAGNKPPKNYTAEPTPHKTPAPHRPPAHQKPSRRTTGSHAAKHQTTGPPDNKPTSTNSQTAGRKMCIVIQYHHDKGDTALSRCIPLAICALRALIFDRILVLRLP